MRPMCRRLDVETPQQQGRQIQRLMLQGWLAILQKKPTGARPPLRESLFFGRLEVASASTLTSASQGGFKDSSPPKGAVTPEFDIPRPLHPATS